MHSLRERGEILLAPETGGDFKIVHKLNRGESGVVAFAPGTGGDFKIVHKLNGGSLGWFGQFHPALVVQKHTTQQ